MDKIIIEGGRRLKGQVTVTGAKNAALPILAATILADGPSKLTNLPDLVDIRTMVKLLAGMGMKVDHKRHKAKVGTTNLRLFEAPYDLVRTMRASILVLGPMLARYGRARVSLPGGCAIGARPVDLHLKALAALGAKVELTGGYVEASCRQLKGARIFFDTISVTGTENAMMAATLAKGTTVIENAAREPEVMDLAAFLTKMGAKIQGAGNDTILIEGVATLTGSEHAVMADRIEAGTFMIAAAMTRGDVKVTDIDPLWVEALIAKLKEAGAEVIVSDRTVHVKGPGEISPVDITTHPFPGFATDFQAQFMAMMTLARGQSLIKETIFENRYMHVGELTRMGAKIKLDGNAAVVEGVPYLSGAPVMATDLRASASLILAGLAARDITEIHRVYHLDRGYERIEKRLRKLGARVKRVQVKY